MDGATSIYHFAIHFHICRELTRAFRMRIVSGGGYRHFIGFNTSQREGAPPPRPEALGLKNVSFVLPDRADMDQLLARIKEVEMAYNQNDEGILVIDAAQNSVLFSIETNIKIGVYFLCQL